MRDQKQRKAGCVSEALKTERLTGVHLISNEVYHEHPALGSTTLKTALKSLGHFKAMVDGRIPRKSSSAFDIGTAAHSAILEKSFSTYVQGPDCDKRTKQWKEFVSANEGKIVLKPDEYAGIKGMYEAFNNHEIAPKLIANGLAEHSYFCDYGLLYLKARPDFYIPDTEKGNVIVDYKTTTSALAKDFSKAIANYAYDFSAAHYMAVVEKVTGSPIKEFIWIVQEKEAPYAIQVFVADSDCIERAKRKHSRVMEQVALAYKTNEWPCYNSMIQPIDVPAWAINEDDYE